MRYAILSVVLSTVAGIASAWTQPVGDPTGNPISKPEYHEKVPCGKPYTITWSPTLHPAPETVTLLLVKGPSSNVIPQYAIAEKVPNSGKCVWTPDASLPDSSEGWGLQLIVDSTGQYQWSPQFGFSNPGVVDHTTGATTTTTTLPHKTEHPESSVTGYPDTTTTTEIDYATTTTISEETTTYAPVRNTTITARTTSTSPTNAETTTYGKPTTISTIIAPTANYTARSSQTTSYTARSSQTNSYPSPTPSTHDSGVSKNTGSFSMALLAIAVVCFSML